MVLLQLVFLITVGIFKVWGCPQPHAARVLLEVGGYKGIEVETWRGYRCLDYMHATGFHALSPTGSQVTGVVCCGVLKACTVNISSVVRAR